MSLAESIKERSKASVEKIAERIRESTAYAQAMDRYQSMNPAGQKLTKLILVVFGLLLVLFIPASNLSNSSLTLSLFEEKRGLIRDLFRTYRESSSTQNIPIPPSNDMLKSAINSILQRANLLPEQKLEVSEASAEGRLIPTNLVSNVIFVRLAKLNLKQIVDIGTSIAGISESVKMKDLAITANPQDTRYFDVTYKLYTLKVPEPTAMPAPEIETKPAPGRNRNNETSDGDAGADE